MGIKIFILVIFFRLVLSGWDDGAAIVGLDDDLKPISTLETVCKDFEDCLESVYNMTTFQVASWVALTPLYENCTNVPLQKTSNITLPVVIVALSTGFSPIWPSLTVCVDEICKKVILETLCSNDPAQWVALRFANVF